jgi:hypothetical protein
MMDDAQSSHSGPFLCQLLIDGDKCRRQLGVPVASSTSVVVSQYSTGLR